MKNKYSLKRYFLNEATKDAHSVAKNYSKFPFALSNIPEDDESEFYVFVPPADGRVEYYAETDINRYFTVTGDGTYVQQTKKQREKSGERFAAQKILVSLHKDLNENTQFFTDAGLSVDEYQEGLSEERSELRLAIAEQLKHFHSNAVTDDQGYVLKNNGDRLIDSGVLAKLSPERYQELYLQDPATITLDRPRKKCYILRPRREETKNVKTRGDSSLRKERTMYYGQPEIVIIGQENGEITITSTDQKSKLGYYSSQYLRVPKMRSTQNSMISAEEFNNTSEKLNTVDTDGSIVQKARSKWLKPDQGFISYSAVLNDLYKSENNWPMMHYDTGNDKNKSFGQLNNQNLKKAFNIQPGQTGRGEYLLAAIFPNLVVIGGSAAEAGIDVVDYEGEREYVFEVKEVKFRVGVKSTRTAIKAANAFEPVIAAVSKAFMGKYNEKHSGLQNIKQALMNRPTVAKIKKLFGLKINYHDHDTYFREFCDELLSLNQNARDVYLNSELEDFYHHMVGWPLHPKGGQKTLFDDMEYKFSSLEISRGNVHNLASFWKMFKDFKVEADLNGMPIGNTYEQVLRSCFAFYLSSITPKKVLANTNIIIVKEDGYAIYTPDGLHNKIKETFDTYIAALLDPSIEAINPIGAISSGGAQFDLTKLACLTSIDDISKEVLDLAIDPSTTPEATIPESYNRWLAWATRK